MKRSTALLAISMGLLFWPCPAQAQQAITIKTKERVAGDAAIVRRSDVTKSTVTVSAGGQVVLDQKETKKTAMEYKETILKREAGKQPTRLQREYTKAQSGKDDKLEDVGLAGKTVLIEKKDGKYVFTYKGGEPVEGDAANTLKKDFSNKSDIGGELEKLVLPNKDVKPGDTWNIEMPKIASELAKQGGMELDGAKSTGKGTLIKAYKKDGKQFGEMKFSMELPLVTLGKDKEQLKFDVGAKISIDLSLDVCVDGTSEAGTMKMKMIMAGNAMFPAAPGATAMLNVIVEGTQTQADVPKK